ncbi:MAG: CotH kinase family protein [Flavobacteriales bacterium]|nr:CotH kinase family protein [Flavobacteriales bacterium]
MLSQVVLNEVQTANMSTLADQDGQFKDWFELYNSGTAALDLSGYGLSDDVSMPLKWTLPAVTLDPGSHLLIWASGKNLGGGTEHYETAIFNYDVWKYIIPASEPSSAWRFTGYNDALWNAGTGGLGYGDGDDGTDVGTATSVYMRKTFNLINPETITNVILHLDYDDAFVAYLNGVEIARANMGVPGTPPAYSDLAFGDHEAIGYQGQAIDAFVVDAGIWNGLMVEGENVLAVQVHNSNPGSSDLTGNAFLTFAFASLDMQFSAAPAWMGYGNSSNELHTTFSLSTNEALVLSDAGGNIIDQIIVPPTALENSYCRESSGDADWCFAAIPTPGDENANTVCATAYESIPVFNIESGMYNITQFISLTTTSPTAEIHYTTDGSVPDLSSPLYTNIIALDTTATISAKCFSTGALLPSPVEKNTYMIDETFLTLPVISISTNPENLWDENIGIYVLGPPDYDGYPYFGSNIWEDWERASYIEYFNSDGDKEFEGPVGLKIHGGWSRAQPQKSLRIVCRDDYGMDEIVYPLIPDKPFIDTYKGFNLRNGGNEYGGPRYHDALMHRATKGTHTDYMGYTPVLAFLNGEYWGMYELRENMNEHYCEDNSGVPADESTVISYNYMGFNVINGSDETFFPMFDMVMNTDPADPDFFTTLGTMLDIENYADYIIAETYYANGDWSNGWINNTKFWHNDQPGGKWRFMLMDLDFGLGLADGNTCADYINTAQDEWYYTDQMFSRIIQNPEFREYFIIRHLDLVNSVFRTEKLEALRDEMRGESFSAMPRHCQTWGTDFNWWYYGFDYRLDWNSSRQNCIVSVLQNHFNLGNSLDITLNVIPEGAGRIHISTIEPTEDEYPWTGTYVNGIPVQITVIANPGYVFDHWAPNGIFPVEVNTEQFFMNFEEDEIFTAYFTGSPIADAIEVTEFMYHADDAAQSGDWVELHNKLDVPVDLSSMYLKDQSYFNRFDVPLNVVVPAGGYMVLAEDTAQFSAQHPEVENVVGPWQFELNNDQDQVRLFAFNNDNLIHLDYTDNAPWPAQTDGTGRTAEFDMETTQQNNGLNWFAGCIGGSPGMPYDPLCGQVLVEEITSLIDWNIFPNPTDAIAYITVPAEYAKGEIVISDVTGKRISEISLGGNTIVQLDASGLPQGMYTIQLVGHFGQDVKKMVVQ